MVFLQELSEILQAEDPEQRQMITGVSWENYQVLLDNLGDNRQYRVTYLDGVIELVSPSRSHERYKTIIGSLLEAYFQENRIRYFPLGSTTFRKPVKKGGTEPDESYCIGTEKELPDLAIEIIVTSGGVDKLKVYQILGIKEIWFFKNNQFEVYILQGENYQQSLESELLPNLDVSMLAEYAIAPDPLQAVLAFRERVSMKSPGNKL
ncbi:Uma2 family endonuclease [Chrysosporum bergii ANA360D]|uniref:Uma2 family endonuclease n=1 Tax=Chrysosporum bergii ANA360D TaxID=617107 RepID=A0AA43GP12_9CYAN|nr:Uma2 family endonuclease [Chrysosporum bergii]MDH6058896.1 Uma2 family endonuclease [Chrysosporum bergii ANA360D]